MRSGCKNQSESLCIPSMAGWDGIDYHPIMTIKKKGPVQLPREERFWARVDRSGGPEACWPWTAAILVRGGYGAFYDDDQRNRRAHIIAWELTNGPVPPGLVVKHRCDNPPCCNPACLTVGTQASNLAEMRARGRWEIVNPSRGEHRYNAKLTEEIVRWAVSERATGRTWQSIADEIGCARQTISMAARGTSWRHVSQL